MTNMRSALERPGDAAVVRDQATQRRDRRIGGGMHRTCCARNAHGADREHCDQDDEDESQLPPREQ
jgi:hypothetical protein